MPPSSLVVELERDCWDKRLVFHIHTIWWLQWQCYLLTVHTYQSKPKHDACQQQFRFANQSFQFKDTHAHSTYKHSRCLLSYALSIARNSECEELWSHLKPSGWRESALLPLTWAQMFPDPVAKVRHYHRTTTRGSQALLHLYTRSLHSLSNLLVSAATTPTVSEYWAGDEHVCPCVHTSATEMKTNCSTVCDMTCSEMSLHTMKELAWTRDGTQQSMSAVGWANMSETSKHQVQTHSVVRLNAQSGRDLGGVCLAMTGLTAQWGQ